MKRNNYSVHHDIKKLNKYEKEAQKKREKLMNKNRIGLNQLVKPALLLIISIILEIVNFSVLKFTTNGGANQILPTYIFFDIAFWLIVCGIMLACSKNWVSNLIFYATVAMQIIYCVANISLHKSFGYFFTWDMLPLIGEAIESFDSGFIDIASIILYVVAFAILIALPILLDKFLSKKKFTLSKLSKPIFCLICFLSCFTLGATTYGIQALALPNASSSKYKEIESSKYLYNNMHIREEAYRKFGTWGFYAKNVFDMVFPANNNDKDQILQEIKDSTEKENKSASLYNQNLIMIMLESFEWFAIDPYCTPNLWKLKTGDDVSGAVTPSSAVVLNNYISNNKTNVSEDVAILGYMPNRNILQLKSDNLLASAFSLPNLFKARGYTTSYFHSWEKSFYDRDVVNKNMGFDNVYTINDFEADNKSTKFGEFNREADFAEQMMDKIAPTNKKFMSFYTTVSTHGNYETENPRFEEYYNRYDTNLESIKKWMTDQGYNYPTEKYYQEVLRKYKCAAIDTDVMIGKLFTHLESNNLLDSTTIVMYADHNSYFHDLTYKIKGTDKFDYSSLKTQTVPFMIYSKKLTANTRASFCNTYDIYPTICKTFGLAYCTLFTQGYNVLTTDISSSAYVSYLTGYYNNKCYSKNMRDIVKYEGATDQDVETFKTNICKFYQKQQKIEAVYFGKWKADEIKS